MSDTKQRVGENATAKLTRLLRNFNTEMIQEGSGDVIEARFLGDGSGLLVLVTAEEFRCGTPIFGFESLDALAKYLEMTPLNRLLTSIAQSGR